MKEILIEQFNMLTIPGMEEVKELYEAKGSFVNLPFLLPSGLTPKFWDDDKTYYIAQLENNKSDRCFGLTADEMYLMVCEYGEGGSNPEIVLFKRWN